MPDPVLCPSQASAWLVRSILVELSHQHCRSRALSMDTDAFTPYFHATLNVRCVTTLSLQHPYLLQRSHALRRSGIDALLYHLDVHASAGLYTHRSASLPLREHSISASVAALSRCVSMLQLLTRPSMAYRASSCICTSSPRS